MMPRE
jgi:hypothetical protein